MQINFGQMFMQGGWVMWPLLVFSVITWAVILERAFVLLTLRPKLNRIGTTLLHTLKSGDVQTAKQILVQEKPQVAEVFLTIF